MNSVNRDQYISLAADKSGGSKNQPYDSQQARRGIYEEQKDPLVLWWVKLLKADYSAEGSKHQSYRRSRWGHRAAKKSSPYSPYFVMHKEGRLLTYTLCACLIGLTASLNMVAQAEPAKTAALTTLGTAAASEIQPAERFSRMKDFVGKHNQYLNLSNLNEFKWTDQVPVTAATHASKRAFNGAFNRSAADLDLQPQVVNQENGDQAADCEAKLREEAQNTAGDRAQLEPGAGLKTTK